MKKNITYFMWGYQHHFNHSLKYDIQNLLGSIGIDYIDLDTFLVGIRSPELSDEGFPICVEPEDGKWDLSIFDNFSQKLSNEIKNHPLKNMFYSNDERATREKPENIRRDSISKYQLKSKHVFITKTL